MSRTIDQQIIFGGDSLAHLNNPTSQKIFTPLSFSEVPTPGYLVGIDCEFVTLNQVCDVNESIQLNHSQWSRWSVSFVKIQ